ncbi:hypothetical protein LguiB_022583 [Lonicera macranthoides]
MGSEARLLRAPRTEAGLIAEVDGHVSARVYSHTISSSHTILSYTTFNILLGIDRIGSISSSCGRAHRGGFAESCTGFILETLLIDLPLQLDPGPKLRLMCSYGGHIIPRPHDQSLCYVGGDTRIEVVDCHSSLSSLLSRLARTLFHGRQFTLKYQLPDDDLDSLISVTTDDDFLNMIDEYDRTVTSSKPSRLRLFLFLAKPETATSMGSLLDDAKSETWFVDALNGAALLQRGVSDSAAVNNLLEFDGFVNSDCCKDLEAHNENFNKQVNSVIDIESNLPDSPLVETNSSFGSGSSCPSTPNLAPINVRVEDQIVGLDEKFSNISVAAVQAATVSSNVGSGENPGRVMGDEERSDPRAASGFRKPPLPLQLGPRKICNDSNCSLLSPDSKHASPDSRNIIVGNSIRRFNT